MSYFWSNLPFSGCIDIFYLHNNFIELGYTGTILSGFAEKKIDWHKVNLQKTIQFLSDSIRTQNVCMSHISFTLTPAGFNKH